MKYVILIHAIPEPRNHPPGTVFAMPFLRIPDDLPSPQAYLRAGIPRPLGSVDQDPPARHDVVTDVDELPGLDGIHSNDTPGGRSFTVTSLSGNLVGVVWTRSNQYLTRPVRRRAVMADVVSTSRTSSGLLHVERGTEQLPLHPGRRTPVDLDNDRIVTLDPSVMLAGLDPARFEPQDVIFISAALAMEIAVMVTSQDGREPDSVSFRTWNLSVPVPIDQYVLRMYARICEILEPPITRNTAVDRTNLICAATAILYEAPLYTAKPEEYAGVRNGLKVIPYGPVRNKSAPQVSQNPFAAE